ncbi:hypothetical protein [Anaeromyxobacter paludicola]|uniref:HTH iclR-type domain-containing protein n=1 Tax=Anaeromyxobacter paludicola TaxID=2918171 RepID=A0ABM7X9Q6_9BACT|nr:hypothetical protein [Anaeromyxobacter paludicola]BDG08575.1 hypothetical protein AMPC_16880 [Anaeromyxobacter paludicola]
MELLRAENASYIDRTGNLRLSLSSPAVFIETQGAQKDPAATVRPIGSLKGPAAGRVVRALCDYRPPFGVRELAKRSQTPLGSVSRAVAFVEKEALLTREPRGPVLSVDWSGLIRRWTQEYSLTGSNEALSFLEPRGLEGLLAKLKKVASRYSVTGSLAAGIRTSTALSRLGVVFVEDIEVAASELGLKQSERGANVMLVRPFDPVVFERGAVVEGVRYTCASQVAADLLTSPGRGPAEGEELLRWMQEHRDEWGA